MSPGVTQRPLRVDHRRACGRGERLADRGDAAIDDEHVAAVDALAGPGQDSSHSGSASAAEAGTA